MFARNTDRVIKRTTVIGAVLVVGVVGAAAWFGADLLRARNTSGAQVSGPGIGPGAIGEPRATSARADAPAEDATASGAASGAAPGATSAAKGAPAAGAASPALDGATDTTIVLADGEVLVSYPDGFGLAVTQEQLLVSSQIPPCDQGFDYCLYLDTDEFAGTNFSAAGVRIDQRDDLTSEADCMLAQPGGFVDLVPVIAGASDFATTMYQDVGEGAAGHVSNGSLGRLYYESACYEFETRVAHAQFGNFPRGAVVEFDARDIESTEERLMSVLDQVTLPDGRSGLWARKVPTEPVSSGPDAAGATPSGSDAVAPDPSVADVAIAEPEPDSSVQSPLRLVGAVSGTWFFEASFPYQVLAVDGTVLASGVVVAESDWMTEALVPFEASIEFDVTAPTDAVLVLARDNPSGLPENDASYEIPLHLLP